MLVTRAHLLSLDDLVHRQLVLAFLDQRERDAIMRRRDELVLPQHFEPLDGLPHPPARALRVALRSMNLAQRHEQVAHAPVEIRLHERGHAGPPVVGLAQRQAFLQRGFRVPELAFRDVGVRQHAHREAVNGGGRHDFSAQRIGAVHHLDGLIEVAVVQRAACVLHGPHDQRGNLPSVDWIDGITVSDRWRDGDDDGRRWGWGEKAQVEPQPHCG